MYPWTFDRPYLGVSFFKKIDFMVGYSLKNHYSINHFVIISALQNVRHKHSYQFNKYSISKARERAHAAKRVIVEACPSRRLGICMTLAIKKTIGFNNKNTHTYCPNLLWLMMNLSWNFSTVLHIFGYKPSLQQS